MASAVSRTLAGCTIAACVACWVSAATSDNTPVPTTTSYASAPATRIRTGSADMRTHAGQDLGRDVVYRSTRRHDRVGSHLGVDRATKVEQRLEPSPRVLEQQWPIPVEPHPGGRICQPDVEKDDHVPVVHVLTQQ